MKLLTPLAMSLLIATTLSAQDAHFGLQATVSKPSGDVGNKDWMDSKLGYGIGVHILIPLSDGIAIVPRIDYTMYKNDRTIDPFISNNEKVKILSGGADFHFYLSGKVSKGFYFLGGLGYARGSFNSSYAATGLTLTTDGTKGALYLQGGIGVNFTPSIGIECRYQSIQFKDVETTYLGYTATQDVSCPSLQASLVLRF